MPMTEKQKREFSRRVVDYCDYSGGESLCPSDFGLEDIGQCSFKSRATINCRGCAANACKKFFEENNL